MAAGPKQAAIHVGDRVAVRLDAKSTEESRGEVRYVGPSGAQRAVVGIRLDERKRGLGDGKRLWSRLRRGGWLWQRRGRRGVRGGKRLWQRRRQRR